MFNFVLTGHNFEVEQLHQYYLFSLELNEKGRSKTSDLSCCNTKSNALVAASS